MKQSGIYRIELGNGWFYIGSAVNLEKRKSEHCRALNRKDHINGKMQNVWNKYDVFKFKILEQCTEDQLLNREQFYLDQCFDDKKNTNLAPKAGSNLGYIHTAEALIKISAAAKNISAETRAKMSAARKGRKYSAESRAKMSIAQKGRVFSAETRAKMSAAAKLRDPASAETRAKLAKWERTLEYRAKISATSKGRVVSDETRKKRSEIKKAYWARKRAANTSSI